jgi:hypothetical protein
MSAIESGDTIALDSGSTTLEIAKQTAGCDFSVEPSRPTNAIAVSRATANPQADVSSPRCPCTRSACSSLVARKGHDAVITLLLAGGAAVDGSPAAGPTPLFMNAQNDMVTSAQLLILPDRAVRPW